MSKFDVFSDRTVKATYQGDTRRVKLTLKAGASAEEAYAAIRSSVLSLFGISEGDASRIQLRYTDDEGDLCTLTTGTIDDLAQLVPEGVLKLVVSATEKAAQAEPMEVDGANSNDAMQVDNAMHKEQSAEGQDPKASSDEDAAREKLQRFLNKLDPTARLFARNFLQGMDPVGLHNMVGMALTHVESAGACNHKDADDIKAVCSLLYGMEPSAMHALLMNVLENSDGFPSSSANMDQSSSSGQMPGNPLEAMLGAFLGGKGLGKGCNPNGVGAGADSMNPNPMANIANLVGSVLGAKGAGKGFQGPSASGADQGPVDPLSGMIQGLLSGKGAGKNGCPYAPYIPSQPNPMEGLQQLGALFAGKGVGQGGNSEGAGNFGSGSPNPMEAMMGALLGGQTGDNPFAMSSSTTAPPAEAPVHAEAMTLEPPTAERAAFEESVNDLVNMGLVSDRQTARELLTQHGDISAVVAILTDVQ